MTVRIARDPTIRIINLARQAAAHLEKAGDHKRAEDVRSLARSNRAQRTMLASLSQDNNTLRARIAQLEARRG